MDDKNIIHLFHEIDEKATRKNVTHFLEVELPGLMRMSGRSASELKAVTYDGMPKSSSSINTADETIVRRLTAEQAVKEVIKAISICDKDCKQILSLLYLDGYTDTMCWRSINYSPSSYFHYWKPKALLQFAESFMYYDLRVFKKLH